MEAITSLARTRFVRSDAKEWTINAIAMPTSLDNGGVSC